MPRTSRRTLALVGLGLVALDTFILSICVTFFDGVWPHTLRALNGSVIQSRTESWQNAALLWLLVASLVILIFLMMARTRHTTILGVALGAFFSVYMSIFLWSLLALFWPPEIPPPATKIPSISGPFTLDFEGRLMLRWWGAATSVLLVAAMLHTVDPAHIPHRAVIIKRTLVWKIFLATVILSIWIASRP